MLKKILLTLGIISLGLGVLGVFLPLLPTTPFVLLSAYLFAKSSEKFHQRLMNHRIFGQLIRDYNEDKSIPLHAKIFAIATMWPSMLFAIFYIATDKLWLQILLATIATGVTIHILRYKTKKRK